MPVRLRCDRQAELQCPIGTGHHLNCPARRPCVLCGELEHDQFGNCSGNGVFPSRLAGFGLPNSDREHMMGTDMAWASFDQQYPVYDVTALAGPGLLREIRFFERHDGRWLIAFQGILDGNAGTDSSVLLRLDRDGCVLWMSPAAAAALADSDDLVVRNGRLRFRDARADRKLQEAIGWGAGQDGSFMSTHAARPIAADAGDELPMRVYWLMMDAGKITFSFGSDRVSEERLDMAAAIYGLSPTQKRLAALVTEGVAVPEIARRMRIRTNTARTHLQRIFDKTGVRTQPALVRVMLSVVPPI
jgi:DNA-binding CsgD family transcriptional regulator